MWWFYAHFAYIAENGELLKRDCPQLDCTPSLPLSSLLLTLQNSEFESAISLTVAVLVTVAVLSQGGQGWGHAHHEKNGGVVEEGLVEEKRAEGGVHQLHGGLHCLSGGEGGGGEEDCFFVNDDVSVDERDRCQQQRRRCGFGRWCL